MQTDAALQLLLPTDKRNPALSLYRDEDHNTIHVYYGFELLEIVPQDRNHAQYKLLVANLYNAGLKVADLEDVFGFDRKTMRGWGLALRSGDAERLKRALEGRESRRKLTPAIVGFIELRFEEVFARHPDSYNREIRKEVSDLLIPCRTAGNTGQAYEHDKQGLRLRFRRQVPGREVREAWIMA